MPRLYRRVRPKAKYERSLELISAASSRLTRTMVTKSGIMVGLGETMDEIEQTLTDLRAHDCDLAHGRPVPAPDSKHLPVERYYHPDEFAAIKEMARAAGLPSRRVADPSSVAPTTPASRPAPLALP